MARILLASPSSSSPSSSSSSSGATHLPIPLLAAATAFVAVSLVISALCASHNRKSRHRPPPPPSTATSEEHDAKADERVVVLPATHGPIAPADPPPGPTPPRRKLSVSMSLKIPEGLSRVRTGRREAPEKERAAAHAAAEESVWMKTIILGEKCRVPEDGDEGAGEGNGHRSYHPRTPRSVPVSRTNSFIVNHPS